VDGNSVKREEEEGEERRREKGGGEETCVVPNQTDGGSAESDTGYASMGDTAASEALHSTLTRTRSPARVMKKFS